MQFVFVHGVSVRKSGDGQEYERAVLARNTAFAEQSFLGCEVHFHNPYWGVFGGEPRLGGRYLARRDDESLAPYGEPVLPTGSTWRNFVELARGDFTSFISTLVAVGVEQKLSPSDIDALLKYTAALDQDSRSTELLTPDWVYDMSIRSDDDLLDRLGLEIRAYACHEGLGLRDWLRDAAAWLRDRGLHAATVPMAEVIRSATPNVARFFGDVSVYLRNGSTRMSIRGVVAEDLRRAAQGARSSGTGLILVGHSMGANILYDILTDGVFCEEFARSLGFKPKVDILLTVGAQIGLFEEFGLFADRRVGKGPCPAWVGRWWHVTNRWDVLSFAAEGIFDQVKEFSIDTMAHVADAHSAYFKSPLFHARLRNRLLEAGVISK